MLLEHGQGPEYVNKTKQTFACVCVCTFSYMCRFMCGKATSVVAFKCGLQLTSLARLAGQRTPRIHLFKVARVGIASLCLCSPFLHSAGARTQVLMFAKQALYCAITLISKLLFNRCMLTSVFKIHGRKAEGTGTRKEAVSYLDRGTNTRTAQVVLR